MFNQPNHPGAAGVEEFVPFPQIAPHYPLESRGHDLCWVRKVVVGLVLGCAGENQAAHV